MGNFDRMIKVLDNVSCDSCLSKTTMEKIDFSILVLPMTGNLGLLILILKRLEGMKIFLLKLIQIFLYLLLYLHF